MSVYSIHLGEMHISLRNRRVTLNILQIELPVSVFRGKNRTIFVLNSVRVSRADVQEYTSAEAAVHYTLQPVAMQPVRKRINTKIISHTR